MPTVMTHAAAGAALGALAPFRRPRLFWILSAVLPMLPDLDVLAFPLGIPFGSMWGHRGITHSLAAAALIGAVTAGLARRRLDARWAPLAAWFFVVMASHGLLDALTDGGAGIAFFAPFAAARYHFPWHVMPVSPIGLRFFSAWGWHTFAGELVRVWLPGLALATLATAARAAAGGWRRVAARASAAPRG